jgi:hypothetical protein
LFFLSNIIATKKIQNLFKTQINNCSEKQQFLKTKMHVASNLLIKKLYGSAAAQNQIFADLEDA